MNIKSIKKLLVVFLFALTFLTRPAVADMSEIFVGLTFGLFIGGVAGYIFGDNNDSSDTTVAPIMADIVVFTEPDTKNLTLTNPNNQEITIDNPTFNSVFNVSAGDLSSCQPIPAGGTCEIPLTATEEAYGHGTVDIEYDGGKTTTNVSVVITNLDLYKCEKNKNDNECETWKTDPETLASNIILEAEKSPQYYRYENAGKFSWQKEGPRYVNWRPGDEFPSSADVTLADNDTDPLSKCSESSIKPGESCVFTFTDTDGFDHPGDWGVLKAIGKNLGEVTQNVLGRGGLEIVENLNPADQHLGYRSLKVVNTVEGKTVTLNKLEVNVSPDETKIKYCSPTDVDCLHKDECNTSTTTLSDGGSCLVWLKAKPSTTLNKDEDIKVTVTAGGTCSGEDPPDETDTFKFSYEHALYVGGTFTNAGGLAAADYMAKWNGTSWSPVKTSFNSAVRALTTNKNSDLYAGGAFSSVGGNPVSRIAKWNGTGWSPLGTGLYDASGIYTANALTAINNDLYVGGKFTMAGGNMVNNIAMWDGSNWSALGTTPLVGNVPALANIGTDLYLGGNFQNAGGISAADKIAKWNGSWSALGTGLNSTVYALTTMGTDLYAGGNFSKTVGGPIDELLKIAKWDGSNWSALGTGMNANVVALTTMGNKLYAGGWFTTAGGNSANYIAEWDGSNWSALGAGLDYSVHALTSLGTNLYVGGEFTSRIAKWDGSNWSGLGTGINNGHVYALTTAPSLLITEHVTSSP